MAGPPIDPDPYDPIADPRKLPVGRRAFLLTTLVTGAGLALPGCQTAASGRRAELPGPIWPTGDTRRVDRTTPRGGEPPQPRRVPRVDGVRSRSHWAKGGPVPSLMEPMRPVRYITVHHTAGPAFDATDSTTTMARLDSVRRYHRSLGWGDIGYHFAVDRSGRVWECRPLRWQGAHVKDHNEGNIGVVAIGNFDVQQPSDAQLDALTRHVGALMNTYRVPGSRLRTHQEWAATACPGRALQRYVLASRSNGAFA